jgi:hypothetical protein
MMLSQNPDSAALTSGVQNHTPMPPEFAVVTGELPVESTVSGEAAAGKSVRGCLTLQLAIAPRKVSSLLEALSILNELLSVLTLSPMLTTRKLKLSIVAITICGVERGVKLREKAFDSGGGSRRPHSLTSRTSFLIVSI